MGFWLDDQFLQVNLVIIIETMDKDVETIRKTGPTIHKATNTIGPKATFAMLRANLPYLLKLSPPTHNFRWGHMWKTERGPLDWGKRYACNVIFS